MNKSLKGFIAEIEPQYKRIKVQYNTNADTREVIRRLIKNDLHNPIFYDGFWVKYTGKTMYQLSANEENLCTLESLVGRHVVLDVQIKNYVHKDRAGWCLMCKKIVLDE